jgi:hypothetical protein
MREFVEPLREPAPQRHPDARGIRHVLYARSAEAWRIDAYIMMLAAAAKARWSEGFERLEGSLLGYEEWQTDLHLERLRAGPHAKKFYWLRKPQSASRRRRAIFDPLNHLKADSRQLPQRVRDESMDSGCIRHRLYPAYVVESAPGQAWRSWKSCEGKCD